MEELGIWLPDGPETASNIWSRNVPIIIDLGTYQTRVGIASESNPSHVFLSKAARFRDRRSGDLSVVVGNDIRLEFASIQNSKNIDDQGIIVNWDTVECILDYSFDKLGVTSPGSVESPIVMSQQLAGPHLPRRTMTEILFEGYNVPKLAYGIDSLFSFLHNSGPNQSGLIVSAGHVGIYIIPVLRGIPDLQGARRINWGGRHATDFMQQLLALKYPLFPTRVTAAQAELMVHRHCYISKNYTKEINTYLDLPDLANRERIIQAPMAIKEEKSEQERERIAERRRESGLRLQEQAARVRAQKLAMQEQNLEALRDLRDTRDESAAREAGFHSLKDLERSILKLDHTIRRARGESVEEPVPDFSLVDVPDANLSATELKEKKRQRLLKASYDARQRIKAEKAEFKAREEERRKLDEEWRQRDLQGWIAAKRQELAELLLKIREIKAGAQKNQQWMGEYGADMDGRKKRKKGDLLSFDEEMALLESLEEADDDSNEEIMEEKVQSIQLELLEFDPDFTAADLDTEKIDWRESVVHKFLYGAHPLDPESETQSHQLNLNVERIRVPEAMFEPYIVGIDQAGISEIAGEILTKRYPQDGLRLAENILITGGLAHFENFEERLRRDLQSQLPTGTKLNIYKASDPSVDAWRGMAHWATLPECEQAYITRKEYEEKGPDYFKVHTYSNVF